MSGVEPYYQCDEITRQALLFLLTDCLKTIRVDAQSEAGIHGIEKVATSIENVPKLLGGHMGQSDAETLLGVLTDPDGAIPTYVFTAFRQAAANAAMDSIQIPDPARVFMDRLRITG